jgi:hypothetical protein
MGLLVTKESAAMADDVSKFNLPGESRQKYGKDFFDDAGDAFAAALDRGDLPAVVPEPSRTNEMDDDVFSAAGNPTAKYGR